jgi:hypothetical protein
MRTSQVIETGHNAMPEQKPPTENRWCDRHGYFIDVHACRARAEQQSLCRRCLARWQQLTLPFPDPF